jgi:ABC-type glycerol-3-phosphate transport system substrate-binding protein
MLSSTSTGRRPRRTLAISLTAAAALALSACGGSDSSSTTTGASGATGVADSTTTGGSVAGTAAFQDQLRQRLEDQGKLTPDQITCVTDKVSGTLSDADLQDQAAIQKLTLDALDSCGVDTNAAP